MVLKIPSILISFNPSPNGAFLASTMVQTEPLDLPLRSPHPLSTIRYRPETASEARQRKLPTMSPKQDGPRPPFRFRDPATIFPKQDPPAFVIPWTFPFAPRPVALPSIPALAKANLFCYLASVAAIPIPLLPKRFEGPEGYAEDLNEVRLLMEIFGETRVWSLDVEDVACRYCVDMMRYHDQHRLKRIRVRTAYVENVFKRVDCGHCFVFPLKGDACEEDMLKYDIPLRRLTHHLGPTTTSRIQNIFLRLKTLDLNILSSALDILTKTLTNLQTLTILLPPLSTPLTPLSTRRLWRSLQLLDRHLPPQNTIKIEGLYQPGYEKLEVQWRDARKSWWWKNRSTRVLARRGHRSVVLRSDLCEEMGYPLPGRCEDYPINYFSFL